MSALFWVSALLRAPDVGNLPLEVEKLLIWTPRVMYHHGLLRFFLDAWVLFVYILLGSRQELGLGFAKGMSRGSKN